MKQSYFGTDGIRTRVGTEPLTTTALIQLGNAIGLWGINRYRTPRILIAQDTRISGDWIKHHLLSGLLNHHVTVSDGACLTTPAAYSFVCNEKQFDIGIVISASHNPYTDNGIKIIDAHEGKLSAQTEHAIMDYVQQEPRPITTTNSFGTARAYTSACDDYTRMVARTFTSLYTDKKIVFDCAHGAASSVMQILKETLLPNAIIINNEPTGTNINQACGAVHPDDLVHTVTTLNADIGFAFDGDADRIIAVNKHGQIKDGDDIVALLLTHPRYRHTTGIVGTIMSNHGLALHLQQHNKQFVRTNVGDKHVSQALKHNNLLLGSEPSGHVIAYDHNACGDGIFIALLLLETIELTGNVLLESFVHLPQAIVNIPIKKRRDLDTGLLAHSIQAAEAQLKNGRIVVRYSGTEPVLRIMAEDTDAHHAQTIVAELAVICHKELS